MMMMMMIIIIISSSSSSIVALLKAPLFFVAPTARGTICFSKICTIPAIQIRVQQYFTLKKAIDEGMKCGIVICEGKTKQNSKRKTTTTTTTTTKT